MRIDSIRAMNPQFCGTKNSLKTTAKKVIKHVGDHPGEYAVGGVGVYVGTELLKDMEIPSGEVAQHATEKYIPDTLGAGIGRPTGYMINPNAEDSPGIFAGIKKKLIEKLGYDKNYVPDWVDPSQPYLTDSTGNYLTDDYGVLVNPWYDETLADAAEPAFTGSNIDLGDDAPNMIQRLVEFFIDAS